MKEAVKNNRNYGIDLLRLISMFFVMVLHSLLASKMLDAEGGSEVGYRTAWFFEALCYGAVNIFAIISGYVGYRKEKRPLKIKRLLSLWGQVIFYGLAIFLVVRLLRPEVATRKELWTSLMPVTHRTYWYLTAFVPLFFVMPILNAGVRSLTKKQCRNSILVVLAIFSFTALFTGDIFALIGGYSFVWIAAMYWIGAVMKKTELLSKLRIRWCLLGYLALSLIAWAVKMFGIEKISGAGFTISRNAWVSYCSPCIVISSMLLVSAFSRIRISAKPARVIAYFAPCAFAAYILNTTPLTFHYLPRFFGNIKESGIAVPLIMVHVFLFAVAFFVVSLLIDRMRLSTLLFVKKKIKKK